MNIAVAVAAGPSERIGRVRQTETAARSRRVHCAVAFVAEPRTRHCQQVLIIRAVRIVAIEAVLAHWDVFI